MGASRPKLRLAAAALALAWGSGAAAQVPSAPSRAVALVGLTPEGGLGVASSGPEGAVLEAHPLAPGPAVVRARCPGAHPSPCVETWARQLGWRPAPEVPGRGEVWPLGARTLRARRDPALGGRRQVTLWLAEGGLERRVGTVPDVHGVVLGPLYRSAEPDVVVLVVRQGGIPGLVPLHLGPRGPGQPILTPAGGQ